MLDLRSIANMESRGPATLMNCKSCGAPLAANDDWSAGSGHRYDCDYLASGVTYDPGMQRRSLERKAWAKASEELRRMRIDSYLARRNMDKGLDGGWTWLNQKIQDKVLESILIKLETHSA